LVCADVVSADAVEACDPSEDARKTFAGSVPGAEVAADNSTRVAQADVVFLAVKPQQIAAALDSIRDSIHDGALVVSIAAGVTLDRLTAARCPNRSSTPLLASRGPDRHSCIV
jgi:pyrroline-5-carboxylate reductase